MSKTNTGRAKALPRPTLQILLALAQRPMHGYGIKLDVEKRTDGDVRLGSGTLYEAIQRLLDNGWIEEVEAPADSEAPGGPARRFYALTREGEAALRAEIESMQKIIEFARDRKVLSLGE